MVGSLKKHVWDRERGKDVGLAVWDGENYLEAHHLHLLLCPLAPSPDGSQELGDRGNSSL